MTLLLAALLAAGAAGDGFRAVQYAPKAATLRGCAECKGEPDDACEVHAGIQTRPLEEFARQRWPAPGRIKLMRSHADQDCAVPARSLMGAHAPVELAAIRVAPGPPAPALLEKFAVGPAIQGWPRKAQDHKLPDAKPDRAALRTALVCWPSEHGWPHPAAAAGDARTALEKENSCELWMVAVRPDTGEPDAAGASFPLGIKPFSARDPRWAAAFDPAVALEDALLPPEAPEPPPAAPAPVAVASAPAAPQACGDAARDRTATLDRFDQWDRQVRGSRTPSFDRASFTLDAAAWSGHCQELDVLHAALDQQLGCATALSGNCKTAGEAP